MSMRRRSILLFLAAAANVAIALDGRAAETLEELLEQTKNSRNAEAAVFAAREQEFLANRDRQAALLAEAHSARDAAEARSKELSTQFDANEVELTNRDELLTQRLGSL